MRVFSLVLFSAIAWSQTATIPSDNANKAGIAISNYPFAGYPATLQYLYSENLVLGSGIKPGDMITGIRFRMRSDAPGGPPVEFTFANWDLTLSKSTRAVGMLTNFIPGNQASDAVPVRRGKLLMPVNSMPSGKLVNDFGLYIPFTKNYPYTGGDLLVGLTHDTGEWDGSHPIDSAEDAANLQHISILRYNVASTDQISVKAVVMQLTYTRPAAGPTITAAGVLNAASYGAGAVAPGEIVTVYGERLGQVAVVAATVANSKFNTMAGSTRVLFDGVPAPMIYSSEKQLAAIVPYATFGKASAQVSVEVGGIAGAPVTVPIVAAIPGIFTSDSSGKGQAAVLNENGSLNTMSNPAAAGSIVVIYLTGEGQTDPAGNDGALAVGGTFPKPLLPATVTIGGTDADVLYAGAAPGAVAGLMQINARISQLAPPSATSAVVVKIGDKSSPLGVTIAVR